MSTTKNFKVSAKCPVFDGIDYPYWNNKMHMHLEAIDYDPWFVVKIGIPEQGEGVMMCQDFRNSTLRQRTSFVVIWPKGNMSVLAH